MKSESDGGWWATRILEGVGENRKVLWQHPSTISDLAETHSPINVHSAIHPSPPTMSKVDNSPTTNQPTKEDAIPGLGVLEEDDEFEEFPVQGEHPHVLPC